MASTVLDRDMYTEAQAARLLRVPQPTLHYWLEGGERRGRAYKPVIRIQATGTNRVTWAEFIEAGLLRQYRRDHLVPMTELRSLIEYLREQSGVPYPLAHSRPYISGRQLLVEAQEHAGLDPEFSLVAPVSGQYVLLPAADAFFKRVTWDDNAGIALRWRPHDYPESPVTIDPDVRFGSPSVGGISTSILFEQSEAGEGEEDLADTYELTLEQVRWALSYELANHATTRAA
jgi:uncharacterized protein (DUF433 family)